MRIAKELEGIDRFQMLKKVLHYFTCKIKCGRVYGKCEQNLATCQRIIQAENELASVIMDLKNPIIKEVAILTNGIHEDN